MSARWLSQAQSCLKPTVLATGFIVLEDFWSESELEEWRSAVAAAVEERPRRWKFPRLGQEDIVNEGAAGAEPDTFYENVFVQRINLWATNQRIKDLWLTYGNEIGRVASALEGVDGYRIWHDQALVKEGWGNPTTLHVDDPFCAAQRHLPSVLCSLLHLTMHRCRSRAVQPLWHNLTMDRCGQGASRRRTLPRYGWLWTTSLSTTGRYTFCLARIR